MSGLLFGVAYYPEYHLTDRVEQDLDLMRDAGINVIRVGESVWSTWEPRDGEFDLEWLAPVLDSAHRRGIRVILGTPTYAVPPWLQVAHPEIAGERRTGERIPWGARQEVGLHATRSSARMRNGSSVPSSNATPGTLRSSATSSTTSRGSSCSTTTTSSRASCSGCASSTATSRR